MKCVKHIFPNETVSIKRVSDKQAETLIAQDGGGYWNYCHKEEWKKEVRDTVKAVKPEVVKVGFEDFPIIPVDAPIVEEKKKKVQGRQLAKKRGEN